MLRLTDRIYLVASGRHGFGLSHPADCHVYLIDGRSEAAFIDAGAGVDIELLVGRVQALPIPADRIRRLFVTHAHADHAGGSAKLRAAFRLEVAASSEVAEILRRGDERAASVDIGKAQGSYPPEYRYEPAQVDAELSDGDRITVGDLVVEAVATPGHSVGHLSYVVRDRHVIRDGNRSDLFTGDTLLFGGQIILQNTWDCDLRTHLESLRHLGEYRFDGLFPGHLTFTVRDGEQQLRIALEAIARGAIPPILV
jgi:glyoxylase-like metal-dependent hydrolase (beta-lactamase superfamily II)